MRIINQSCCVITTLLLSAIAAYSQGSAGQSYYADSLDNRPGWIDSSFYIDVTGSLRWSGWELTDEAKRELLWAGKPVKSGFRPDHFIVRNARTANEVVHILGWYTSAGHYHNPQSSGPDSIGTNYIRHVLTWIRAEDTVGHTRWGLMLIGRAFGKYVSGRGWVVPDPLVYLDLIPKLRYEPPEKWGDSLDIRYRAAKGEIATTSQEYQIVLDSFHVNDKRIRMYDHPPTNRDIYRFLRRAYRQNPDEDVRPAFLDPQKLHIWGNEIFVEGMIRPNTWRKLTGEAPEYDYN